MTYVFIKHRADGKFEIRFSTRRDSHYQNLLLSLRAYIPPALRNFNVGTETWTIEEECKVEVERWIKRIVEEINAITELYCERHEAWEAKVADSYRILHLSPGAPRVVVTAAYQQLVMLNRQTEGAQGQSEKLDEAYEFIMQHIGDEV